MRCYSTQNPITPDSFPLPERNEILEIRNFGRKTYCGETGREARGDVPYVS